MEIYQKDSAGKVTAVNKLYSSIGEMITAILETVKSYLVEHSGM